MVITDPDVLGGVTGQVTVAGGGGLAGVSVRLAGVYADSTTTDGSGKYSFVRVAGGTYAVTIAGFSTGLSFVSTEKSATVSTSGEIVRVDFQGAYPASILLSSKTVGFDAAIGGGNAAPQVVNVTGDGSAPLIGLSAAVAYPQGQPAGWLTAGLSSSTAPATLTLVAAPGSRPVGTYSATVNVASSAPNVSNSPQQIGVTLTIRSGGSIVLSTSNVTFAAEAGSADASVQFVDVTNGGAGSLTGLMSSIAYPAGQQSGWLSATLSTTTAPTRMTLVARPAGLSAGSYVATVDVQSSAPGVANSPQQVTVTFTVSFTSFDDPLEEPDCISRWTIGGRRAQGTDRLECVSRDGRTVGHLYKAGFTEATALPNVGRIPVSAQPTFRFDMEVRVVPSFNAFPTFYGLAGVVFLLFNAEGGQMGAVEYIAATTQYPFDLAVNDPTLAAIPVDQGAFASYSLSLSDILSHLQIDESALSTVQMWFVGYSSHTNNDIMEVWFDNVSISRNVP